MSLFKIIFAFVLLVLVGGFAFFAFTDIKITPQPVEKEIPHERFHADTP